MAVRRPRPEYLSVRSSRTLDPLVAVREDPVETVAESDKMGVFQLIEEEHRPSCLFARQAWSENGWLTDKAFWIQRILSGLSLILGLGLPGEATQLI